jgi:excisionase family DNA binding protein
MSAGMRVALFPGMETPMTTTHKDLKFLTLEQAADLLQVSKRTLHRLIQSKRMPCLKIGGQWRIRETEFKKWVEENEKQVSP